MVRRVAAALALAAVCWYGLVALLFALDAYGPIDLPPAEFCQEQHLRSYYDRGEVLEARRSWAPPQTRCRMAGRVPEAWPDSAWGGAAGVLASLALVWAPVFLAARWWRRRWRRKHA